MISGSLLVLREIRISAQMRNTFDKDIYVHLHVYLFVFLLLFTAH